MKIVLDHGTKEHHCHIHDGGDDSGLVDCRGCEKEMLKHFNNKRLVDIGIKDGCGQPVLFEDKKIGEKKI